MFSSYGYIQYDPQTETRFDDWWMIVRCDIEKVKVKGRNKYRHIPNGMTAYYRDLISRERKIKVNSNEWLSSKGLPVLDESWPINLISGRLISSAWGPHISVVRGEKPKNPQHWKKYQGRKISFEYDPRYLNTNGKHWWVRVISPELESIRKELGLTPQPTYIDYKTKRRKVNPFHLTIGSNFEAPPSKKTRRKK